MILESRLGKRAGVATDAEEDVESEEDEDKARTVVKRKGTFVCAEFEVV